MRKTFPFLLFLFLLLCLGACAERSTPEPSEAPLRRTRYEIEAELLTDTHTLNVTTTVRYTLPQDLAAVKLRLYANAYQEAVVSPSKVSAAYPVGFDRGWCEVVSISGSEDFPSYEIGVEDPTVLTVRLASKHKRGDELTLSLRTVIRLANVKHRLGYDSDSYTLSGFYPVVCPFEDGKYRTDPYYPYGDPFLHETSDFDVTLALPVNMEAAASSLPLDLRTEGNRAIRRYQAAEMREFACVVSPRLLYREDRSGDVTVRYYYEKDSKYAETLACIREAVTTFEAAFGSHPYPSLTVVQAPFFEAGMEFSGLAIVNKDLSASERKRAILHETAHEWWHGKVGSDEVRHPWQDEALAEYSVLYFYACHHEDSLVKKAVDDATEEYVIYAALKGDAPVSHPLSLGEDGYVETTYRKGLLMMISLAEIKGYDEVNRALRAYTDRHANAVASPEAFLEAMQDLTDDPNYFDRWLYTPLPLE